MLIVKTSSDLSDMLINRNVAKKQIGFVATMGALHRGHISLLERSKKENDTSVCSIFVNPRQFNDSNDLKNYPRPIENDIILLTEAGCDILFLPAAEEIYNADYIEPKIDLFGLESLLEGSSRPGHFKGVAVVVSRLFDCVKPDRAYFGQKDFQQTLVIKELVRQFNLPIEIVINDIVREESGLAMSSRNIRIPTDKLQKAGFIYDALLQLKQNVRKISINESLDIAKQEILKNKLTKIEYLEIVNPETLKTISDLTNQLHAIANY